MKNLEDYYKNRPQKMMGSCCIFFNEKNEVLLVKPTYKDYWALPGGGVELNESPMSACIREVKEEVGLNIKNIDFICVDYNPNNGKYNSDSLEFLFFGGILDKNQIKKIKLAKGEIENFKFAPQEEAFLIIGGRLKNRLPVALKLIKNNTPSYLENANLLQA